MSIGLPCISTDCDPGGARLLIEDNLNGILVKKGDIKGISDSIRNLIVDKELSNYIGENGRMIKKKFSESAIEQEWNAYINDNLI